MPVTAFARLDDLTMSLPVTRAEALRNDKVKRRAGGFLGRVAEDTLRARVPNLNDTSAICAPMASADPARIASATTRDEVIGLPRGSLTAAQGFATHVLHSAKRKPLQCKHFQVWTSFPVGRQSTWLLARSRRKTKTGVASGVPG
jgi:hypothetical protein